MRFTANTSFVFFSILVVVTTLVWIGCNQQGMKQVSTVYYVDEDRSEIVPDPVQSALDSITLENTVKLFHMWDDEFCDKKQSEMQRLGDFISQHPELDIGGLNRFEFDTIEEAEMFYDIVEEEYKIRRVDIPFIDGKYVAHFHPSCYPIHW